MRLNFAGVPDEDIREGIRRIGRAMRAQLALLGTLTGQAPQPARGAAGSGSRSASGSDAGGGRESGANGDSNLADVVALPRRDSTARARRRQDR
jgi:2-aminoadipate transaminase